MREHRRVLAKPTNEGPGLLQERLRYPHFLEYCAVVPVAVAIVGLLLVVEFLPAWLDGVFLPHPFIGAWAAYEAATRIARGWIRYRGLCVDVHPEGMRLTAEGHVRFVPWSSIYQLYTAGRTAHFFSNGERYELDGAWPGFASLMQHLIAHAGLVEQAHRPGTREMLLGRHRSFVKGS